MKNGMKLAIISFTRAGGRLCGYLTDALKKSGDVCEGYVPRRYMEAGQPAAVHPLEESVAVWTRKRFLETDGLIFIGAAGIAVRAIAPCLKDKLSDPAVVAVDELGKYAVSLLSGHVGGANVLARRVADLLGAQAVITTASDVNGKVAVDVWAAEHGLRIGSREMAKRVAAAVLDGEPVGFFCDEGMEVPPPEGFVKNVICGSNVRISVKKHDDNSLPPQNCLPLIPRLLFVGTGCRKGMCREVLEQKAAFVLNAYGLYQEAVAGFASIDIKRREAGLLELAAAWKVPFVTFSAEQLGRVQGSFNESDFVRQTAGVGNVCERAALLAAGPGARLIVPKQAADGVTVAVAQKKWKREDK